MASLEEAKPPRTTRGVPEAGALNLRVCRGGALVLMDSLEMPEGKRKGETSKSKKGSKNTSKKSKKVGATTTSTSLVVEEPATTSASLVTQVLVSPGPTTSRMASSTSTPARPLDSPLSPGPTTRRMTVQLVDVLK
ncbi:uncharacterized protein LOC120709578 [Panicum virgatum]|uniref:Uncharacterized protein n=1 Tax=Panicum virgatum TaxID=38727 RepID=A0A8T0XXM0_PANVG|nr:uncharacterized protein LOC120709578 [Panicum virgatum]KAG2660019.1 hypothetical protein PVAP13_1KG391000 [Panicum virgatum]